MTTESGTTEQKLSPLERAKLAKAEAEKRKSDEVARVEAEARSSQEIAESAARERAEQKQQAEAKVGECRATIDAKQVEYDEIAQMAAEGGDAEFVAEMEDLKNQASDALAEARAALEEAEVVLTAFSEPVSKALLSSEDQEAQPEEENELDPSLTAITRIFENTRGLPEKDDSVSPEDLISKKANLYSRSVEATVAEVAGIDQQGLENLVIQLKDKVRVLPETLVELDERMLALEEAFKAKFGKSIKEGFYPSSFKTVPPDVTSAMLEFIKNDPSAKAFLATADGIARVSQDKIKLVIATMVRDGETPTGFSVDTSRIAQGSGRTIGAKDYWAINAAENHLHDVGRHIRAVSVDFQPKSTSRP